MQEIDPQLTDISDCLYRVANKAIIIHDHKLLVVKEAEGWYGLPGGGLDYGESTLTALQRELKEEIGMQPKDAKIDLTPRLVTNNGVIRGIPRLTIYYLVTVKKSNVRSAQLNHSWIDKDELAQLPTTPGLASAKPFLAKLL